MHADSSLKTPSEEQPSKVTETNFNCLNIVPLENKNINENNEDVFLELTFKPPFFAVFLGPSRSGKTTTWLNMLKNPNMLYKRFQEVYYFIPTWFEDPIYTHNIKVENKYVQTEYNPEFFENLIKDRAELIDAYKKVHGPDFDIENKLPKTLIIVDDNIGTKKLSARTFSMLDVLATRGRKYNISTILTIQYLRSVASRIVRGNATDMIIFFMPDAEEQKKVLKEFQGSVTIQDMIQMYRSCFQEDKDKWNFFYIKNFQTNNRNKFRKNLNTVLLPPSISLQKSWDAEHVETGDTQRVSGSHQQTQGGKLKRNKVQRGPMYNPYAKQIINSDKK